MTTLTTTADSVPSPSLNGATESAPLRAAHTPNFPALLRQLGASLLVTTYQAGKLVMVRDEGDHLNTHYRAFKAPMGLALADGGAKLAVGTTIQIWEFRDVPDVARRLEPAGRHDACFLPRSSHVTGNVLIHEMAYGHSPVSPSPPTPLPLSTGSTGGEGSRLLPTPPRGRGIGGEGELWFVNTRFSCLATLDPESSFVPLVQIRNQRHPGAIPPKPRKPRCTENWPERTYSPSRQSLQPAGCGVNCAAV